VPRLSQVFQEGFGHGHPDPPSQIIERVENPPSMGHNQHGLLEMILCRGPRNLHCAHKDGHTVKRKYNQLRENFEVNKMSDGLPE
jgi:hypothetical protein